MTRTGRDSAAGAVRAVVIAFGLAAIVGAGGRLGANPQGGGASGDGFGRLFHLPAFASPTPAVKAALSELGKRGGLMDARDDLSAGPIALIVDPALNVRNPNSDTHTAGITFLGQFLDHDMTFDTSSRLGSRPIHAPSPTRASHISISTPCMATAQRARRCCMTVTTGRNSA